MQAFSPEFERTLVRGIPFFHYIYLEDPLQTWPSRNTLSNLMFVIHWGIQLLPILFFCIVKTSRVRVCDCAIDKQDHPPISKDGSIQPLCLDPNSHRHINPREESMGVSLRAHHPGYVHYDLVSNHHRSLLYLCSLYFNRRSTKTWGWPCHRGVLLCGLGRAL